MYNLHAALSQLQYVHYVFVCVAQAFSILMRQRIFDVKLLLMLLLLQLFFYFISVFLFPLICRFYTIPCPNKYSYARLLHKDFGIQSSELV